MSPRDMSSIDASTAFPIDASTRARLLRDAAASAPLWVTARGSSMGRTIPSESSVLVTHCAAPRRAQVWAYCDQSGAVVVHRYRRRVGAAHVLQGDASAHPDAPVGDEQLVGRVIAVRRAERVRSLGRLDRWTGRSRFALRGLRARASRAARRVRRAA